MASKKPVEPTAGGSRHDEIRLELAKFDERELHEIFEEVRQLNDQRQESLSAKIKTQPMETLHQLLKVIEDLTVVDSHLTETWTEVSRNPDSGIDDSPLRLAHERIAQAMRRLNGLFG